MRRDRGGVLLTSLRGAEATKQSIFDLAMPSHGLLRWSLSSGAHSRDPLARNDGVDGPQRHQCARLVMLILPDKGAAHERD
jgi:hypothetical protein